MKERLFLFSSGSPSARVTCKHCGWTSTGRGDAQKVFDRSSSHECAGVESYAAMQARKEVA
ncbi:hypothetical protein [Micromonospora sp. NPDC005299]|uniref:hypothetical protein n=1 Tax=Micromonospora sp. NPDC005299 TaxID=3364231 RepID=UPI0036893457